MKVLLKYLCEGLCTTNQVLPLQKYLYEHLLKMVGTAAVYRCLR